ncbi:MAG: creatininase family protein [Chloroflexota bacterium]|nr:creatininase family protein [Chloroflexota bacterium]
MAQKLSSVWLNELTWEDVAEYLKHEDIIILPIGSTEQHGPAGPLGLDTYVAISLAEDVARSAGVLCTPPVWFGDSSHHLGFPGTISLRLETVRALVKDIASSLAKHGFRNILIINGHKSANLPALLSATKELREYEMPEVFFAVIDPMKISRGIAAQTKEAKEHHCGELEISEVWHKYPHLIKADKLTREAPDLHRLFSPFFLDDLMGKGAGDTIDIPWTSQEQREFAPTGSLSDSSRASPQKGQRYHDYMVARIVEFIEWRRQHRGPITRQP